MQWRRSIAELDSTYPPSVGLFGPRSTEIPGALELPQDSPHPVPAHSFTRTRTLLQQVRQHTDSNLPAIRLCDEPIRDPAGIELQPSIIDQCAGDRHPTAPALLDSQYRGLRRIFEFKTF